jgi:hypothetical protein
VITSLVIFPVCVHEKYFGNANKQEVTRVTREKKVAAAVRCQFERKDCLNLEQKSIPQESRDKDDDRISIKLVMSSCFYCHVFLFAMNSEKPETQSSD